MIVRLDQPYTGDVTCLGSSPRLSEDTAWGVGFPPDAMRVSAIAPNPAPQGWALRVLGPAQAQATILD